MATKCTRPKRYWFEFDHGSEPEYRAWVLIGCGITANDEDDALQLLRDNVFRVDGPVPIKRIIEDIDVSTLDPGHVLPNMHPPNLRGIWFPLGFEE